MISGSNFLDTVTDNLSYLNPLKQIKTFRLQNCSSYGSTINYVFVFLYGLESDQETAKLTTTTNISHHFSSLTKSKREM